MTEETIYRVLDPADSFCPKCGHNRDKSCVSSIDEGDGRRSCQMCGTQWIESAADQVRAAVLQAKAEERERCIAACEAERAEHLDAAASNNGRASDFAFGSVNSAERIASAIRSGA